MVAPYWESTDGVLYQGHVLDVLRALAPESVHCIVTSPPYWGLRDYQLPPVEWPAVRYAPMAGLPEIEVPGCDPECRHEWGEWSTAKVSKHQDTKERQEYLDRPPASWTSREKTAKGTSGQYCQLCGGWRGCLGLEPTIEMFVGHIVLIWHELWRVLRGDGTCWLNLGGSYVSQGGFRDYGSHDNGTGRAYNSGMRGSGNGLKPKDLIGIPWRVALALQADGWYLRSDIVWAKGLSFCPTYSGSCMPESVRDRPTKGHEYVFLLTKNKRYFYDGDAVRESNSTYNTNVPGKGGNVKGTDGLSQPDWLNTPNRYIPAGRNLRTVWTINPGNFKGAHFATFPPALVEPMIKAGTSARGCCPECGAPWERVTKKTGKIKRRWSANDTPTDDDNWRNDNGRDMQAITKTTGWRPTCTHYDNLYYSDFPKPKSDRKWAQRAASGNWFKRARKRAGLTHWPIVPATILDPFGGSGTTADVARQLGRRWILIELSRVYCDEHIMPRLSEPLIEWAIQQKTSIDHGQAAEVQLELL